MAVQFEQLDLSGYAKINDATPSARTTYSSQKIEEILPEPGAVIDDSEASTTKTYSSTHIDKTYLKKDGNGSAVSVEYTASDTGGAPASGSMLGNLIGWIVGKCNGIGTIANLVTTAKTTLVAAINEVKMEIGDLTQLDTTKKTDIVSAVNELKGSIPTASSVPLTLVTVPKSLVTQNCSYHNGIVTAMISVNLPASMGLGANTSKSDWRSVLLPIQYMFDFGIDSQNNVQQVIVDANGVQDMGGGIATGFGITAKMDKMGMLEISLQCGSYMDEDASNFKTNAGDLYVLVAKQADLTNVTGTSQSAS